MQARKNPETTWFKHRELRPVKQQSYCEFSNCVSLTGFLPIKPNVMQLLHLSESQYPKMRANSADFTLVTFVSLLLLLLTSEGLASSKQFQAAVYNTTENNRWICHDGFMTIYISKVQFADLPFTIYVQGKSHRSRMLLFLFVCIPIHVFIVYLFCFNCDITLKTELYNDNKGNTFYEVMHFNTRWAHL